MATTISSRTEKTRQAKRPTKMSRETDPPNDNEIRILAYQLYNKRLADGTSGDASADWLEAERLLTQQSTKGAKLD